MKSLKKRRFGLITLLLSFTLILSSCTFSFPFSMLFVGTSFDDIKYERPDYEQIQSLTDDILTAFKEKASYSKVEDLLTEFFEEYSHFYTMRSVLEIYSSANTQSEKYNEEQAMFAEKSIYVEKCREEILVAAANSSMAAKLKKNLFGDMLDTYKDYSRYTNQEYFDLALEEKRLVDVYRNTINGLTAKLNNAKTYQEYQNIINNLPNTYLPSITKNYNALVNVRKEMAEVAGYDNYLILAAEDLGRTFSLEEVETYLGALSDALSRVDQISLSSYQTDCISRPISQYEIYSQLSSLCSSLDQAAETDVFSSCYQTMRENYLSDFSYSPIKANTSFTVYLYDYYEPYIFVSGNGVLADVTTVFHEYGHFCDMLRNYNSTSSIDLAEVYSTGLEMIATTYLDNIESDLTEYEITTLKNYQGQIMIETLRSQGILAEFEMAIYDPDSTVNTSNAKELCSLYRDIANKWGGNIDSKDEVSAAMWITVPHIFQYPSYVFSYCISTDIAIQLNNMEHEEPGTGLECYLALMNRGDSDDFLTIVTEAGLESPFETQNFAQRLDTYIKNIKNIKS